MSKKLERKVFQNLNDIYTYILSPDEIKKLTKKILTLCNVKKVQRSHKISEKDILLITYADSIKRNKIKSLLVLEKFLRNFIKNTFNSVHILPFYPSSSDGGFSVIDFLKIDSKHGNWKDLKKISKEYRIMVDIVLNHGSSKSKWFKNFLLGKGEGQDFFYSLDNECNTNHVVRARSHKLLQKYKTNRGYKYLWCTFSRDQVDFDYRNPKVLLKFISIIKFIREQGPSIFRFDAVAFLWKRLESSCINLDQTHAIIRLFRTFLDQTNKNSIIVTETNLPFHENLSYFGSSDEAHMIYNFSLAPLILNTLIKGNSAAFRRWSMSMPPAKDGNFYLNFLATHDGIGIRPLEGIINKSDLSKLLETLKAFGSKFTYRKQKNNNLSVYEANISLMDAMSGTIYGKDNLNYKRFFCAHAIMLSFEGLPAIYIHSLLGTRNDIKLYNKTKVNRSINRHIYNYDNLEKELGNKNSHVNKVFTEMIRFIKIRKKQKAFHPNAIQYTLTLGNNFFGLWRQSLDKKQSIFAISNITNKKSLLSLNKINILNLENWYDLISNNQINKRQKQLVFMPYQTVWITNKIK